MLFRRLRHAAAGLALLSMGGPALAEPFDPRDRVERLLSHRHQTPAKATLEVVPGVDKILRAIAADPGVFVPRRYAAFDALQHWPDGQTRALYLGAVAADQPVGLRHRVLRLWPRAFGEGALPVLQAALADDDRQIRLTAAHALDELSSGAAHKALAGALANEADPTLRTALAALVARRGQVR